MYPNISSPNDFPFSPIHQGFSPHNQSWKTSMMCNKSLLHESKIPSNNEDRSTRSHPTHSTSIFCNHNKSNFHSNRSTTSTPNDGMKCFGSFVDKAFPYNKKGKWQFRAHVLVLMTNVVSDPSSLGSNVLLTKPTLTQGSTVIVNHI